LVNAVVPKEQLDAEVQKWANEMLSLSPTCLKIVKTSLRQHMDAIMGLEMHDVIAKVAPGYFDSGEQLEGTSAFLEKRKPNFDRWR
jgi:2-ketocyclohexanecarboxyl-CoA hydrolase